MCDDQIEEALHADQRRAVAGGAGRGGGFRNGRGFASGGRHGGVDNVTQMPEARKQTKAVVLGSGG